MLRWCQSTVRFLNGQGSGYASNICLLGAKNISNVHCIATSYCVSSGAYKLPVEQQTRRFARNLLGAQDSHSNTKSSDECQAHPDMRTVHEEVGLPEAKHGQVLSPVKMFCCPSAKSGSANFHVAVYTCNQYCDRCTASSGTIPKDDPLGSVFQRLQEPDVGVVDELSHDGLQDSIQTSSNLLHTIARSYISRNEWKKASSMLTYPGFSRYQKEEILWALLQHFQVHRREYTDQGFSATIGQEILCLYARLPPPKRLKYPIRFFLSIMITSRNASKAVDIVEAIYRNTTAFFTMGFFLRLQRTLIRHEEFALSVRLFKITERNGSAASRSFSDMQRKLAISLSCKGAHNYSRLVHRSGARQPSYRTTREALLRAVSFRYANPAKQSALRIIPILLRSPMQGSSVRYATALLVNANRLLAARKLFERTSPGLDAKTRAVVGNILLHGQLRPSNQRNKRLVRHVLHFKDYLMEKCGFEPDRTTVNILLKAILRWQTVIDSCRIKALFDHMIRHGYPASQRWRHEHGVPFGNPPSSNTHSIERFLPLMSSHISFGRHVRPMYKMFIKALYLRGDISGAKMIIGIMREEEVLEIRQREKRNTARRIGIVKKKQKLLKYGSKVDNSAQS